LEKIAEQFGVNWQPTIKLSTEQMIEPMAAPIGFSVQSAQGSGLGPSAQAHQAALTGTQNTDEEVGFQKFAADAIPPPAPGHGPGQGPVVSATPYKDIGSTDNLPTTTPVKPGETTSVMSPLTQATNLNGGGKVAANNSAYGTLMFYVRLNFCIASCEGNIELCRNLLARLIHVSHPFHFQTKSTYSYPLSRLQLHQRRLVQFRLLTEPRRAAMTMETRTTATIKSHLPAVLRLGGLHRPRRHQLSKIWPPALSNLKSSEMILFLEWDVTKDCSVHLYTSCALVTADTQSNY